VPRSSQGCQDHQGREGLLPDLPGRDPEVLGLAPGHGRRRRQGRAAAGRSRRRAAADIEPDPVLPGGSGGSLRGRQTGQGVNVLSCAAAPLVQKRIAACMYDA